MDKQDYASNYMMSSINYPWSTTSPHSNSTSTSTPSTPVATDKVVAAVVENHLYDHLMRRYRAAVTQLGELTREANALHEENEWLRLANEDLTSRLGSVSLSPWPEPAAVSEDSPTSVMERDGGYNEERVCLPKCISVRSPSYFKLGNVRTPVVAPVVNQSRVPSQSHVNGKKLRVRREEKAVEMEVFNQGMYKTELCNKWQETGSCPYGDHCRFAHGLSELRPVIRHPRYKTQVCRMVLAGVACPYGHRCHFRHSSTTSLNS